LWRPVSPYVTWLFANLGLTSVFTVTLSVVFVGSAALLLFRNEPALLITAAISIEIYALLDHVDGELARFEMTYLERNNSRVGHYLDLFAHKISIITMFAMSWAVANATDNNLYTAAGFMLCFFMFGPANEPANEIVIEEAKRSDMKTAFGQLQAFRTTKVAASDSVRPAAVLIFFNELFGFPGWLHLIVIACLLDAFFAPFGFMGASYLYREALIIGLTPIYVVKFIYAIRWYLKVMLSIRHRG
jgi:phosphatidylglycerophosphate synthase